MAMEVAEIVTVARVDLSDFKRKMGEHDERIEESNKKARKGAFFGGLVGGAVGGAVSDIVGTAMRPFEGVISLFGNLLAAALLPVLVQMLPLLETLADLLNSEAFAWFTSFIGKGVALAVETGGVIADILTGDFPARPDTALARSRSSYEAWMGSGFRSAVYPGPPGLLDVGVGVGLGVWEAGRDLWRGTGGGQSEAGQYRDTDSPYSNANQSRSSGVG